MFNNFMQKMHVRKFRKIADKLDSIAKNNRVKHNDYTGYSATIASVTEELVKRPWPADHKSVMLELRDKHIKIYRNYLLNVQKQLPEAVEKDNHVIFSAVLEQALLSKDITVDEVRELMDSDSDDAVDDSNVVKTLKNLQLLPADFSMQ